MFNFDIFKDFLILKEFGKFTKLDKFGRYIWQISLICQVSWSFKKLLFYLTNTKI